MHDGTRDTLVSADTGDAVSLQAGLGRLDADYGLSDGDAVGVQAGVKDADGERDIYRDTTNERLVIETVDDGNTTQRAELAISDAAKLSIAYEAASDRLVFGQQPPSFRLDGDKLDVTGNNISGLNLNVDLAQDPVRAGFDANADPQSMPGTLSPRGGAANEVDLSAFDAAGEKVIVQGNVNANTVQLGDGDEVIRFGDLQGNDRLMGGAGDDTLEIANGGAGTNAFTQDAMLAGIEIVSLADGGHYGVDLGGQSESFMVNGGDGDNIFLGVGEKDGIDGGAGRDTLRLRSGDHHVHAFGDDSGLQNVEVVTLGDGVDYGVDLRGQSENFIVQGGDGANTILLGGGHHDEAHGHGGDDTFMHVGHDDKLDGGLGTDTLRIEDGDERYNNFDRDILLENIETVRLADTPTGSDDLGVDLNGQTEGFMVHGNDGENSLQGGQGADWFYGGEGVDTLTGDEGDDVFVVDDFTATDLITDFSVGDDISFGDVVTGVAETDTSSLDTSATLQDYQDAAANTTAGQVNHFEFNGNTYLVFDADGGATSTFEAGNDGMVELYGSVDLSGLKAVDAGNAEAVTLA